MERKQGTAILQFKLGWWDGETIHAAEPGVLFGTIISQLGRKVGAFLRHRKYTQPWARLQLQECVRALEGAARQTQGILYQIWKAFW